MTASMLSDASELNLKNDQRPMELFSYKTWWLMHVPAVQSIESDVACVVSAANTISEYRRKKFWANTSKGF